MATHIGPHCANICAGWEIRQDPEDELFYIMVPKKCDCQCPNCSGIVKGEFERHSAYFRKTAPWVGEEDHENCVEMMEGLQESYDRDWDDYQETHHYEIVQQERWESFRNEQ